MAVILVQLMVVGPRTPPKEYGLLVVGHATKEFKPSYTKGRVPTPPLRMAVFHVWENLQ